jgi:hypothetical protein
MAQMIVWGPFEELELPDQFGPDPATFPHLFGRKACSPASALRLWRWFSSPRRVPPLPQVDGILAPALGFVELDNELVALHWHAAFPLANRDQSSNVWLSKLARSACSEA